VIEKMFVLTLRLMVGSRGYEFSWVRWEGELSGSRLPCPEALSVKPQVAEVGIRFLWRFQAQAGAMLSGPTGEPSFS
ncbi:MAG: hypothetical protein P1V81_11105, partial [Planctomycetota bacterium]|nr:hypothetical protein [Planctomycetota bacterium]